MVKFGAFYTVPLAEELLAFDGTLHTEINLSLTGSHWQVAYILTNNLTVTHMLAAHTEFSSLFFPKIILEAKREIYCREGQGEDGKWGR